MTVALWTIAAAGIANVALTAWLHWLHRRHYGEVREFEVMRHAFSVKQHTDWQAERTYSDTCRLCARKLEQSWKDVVKGEGGSDG